MLSAFSTPALVRFKTGDDLGHYVAVGITVDPLIGADSASGPATFQRIKVLLHASPDGPPGFHHVPLGDLWPPEDSALKDALPDWCLRLHSAFMSTRLITQAEAELRRQKIRAERLTTAAIGGHEPAPTATAGTAAAAAVFNAPSSPNAPPRLRSRGSNGKGTSAKQRDASVRADAKVPAAGDVDKKLRKMETQVAALKTKVSNLVTTNGALTTRVSHLEQKLDRLVSKQGSAKPPKQVTPADIKRMVASAVKEVLEKRAPEDEAADTDDDDDEDDGEGARRGKSKRAAKRSRHDDNGNEFLQKTITGLIPLVAHSGPVQQQQQQQQYYGTAQSSPQMSVPLGMQLGGGMPYYGAQCFPQYGVTEGMSVVGALASQSNALASGRQQRGGMVGLNGAGSTDAQPMSAQQVDAFRLVGASLLGMGMLPPASK
jgi:regulator of replication initiation timing